MTDFIKIIQKDSKIQDNISQVIDKYDNQSYATKSELGRNALIQSNIYKEAINIMRETINDMDIEID